MANFNFTLKVWRQDGPDDPGHIEAYAAKDIPEEASFLEMLDIVNERLVNEGKEPIHFDHDCREGICGVCSLTINGIAADDGTENMWKVVQDELKNSYSGCWSNSAGDSSCNFNP